MGNMFKGVKPRTAFIAGSILAGGPCFFWGIMIAKILA